MASGIYVITCKGNNKIYVGSACKLSKRKNQHFSLLSLNKHPNKYLQASYGLYGKESFSFEVIENVENVEDLISREQFYIDSLKATDRNIGMNLCPIAGNQQGRKVSTFSKQKMRESHLGKTHTEESKKKIGAASRDRQHTEETKNILALVNKGKGPSEQNRQKSLEFTSGENNWCAKLTGENIRQIKILLNDESCSQLAKKFNVHVATISDIKHQRTWKHIN